jgi:hypothetical protein
LHRAARHMFANRFIGGLKVPCVAIFIVVVLVIILYGCFLRKTRARDVLAKRLFDHPVCQEIDGWSVSHLVFFGLLGFLYPGHHLQFLAVGVFWEGVETALGQNVLKVRGARLQLIGDQDEAGFSTDEGEGEAYWYGKGSDIIMNNLGYAVGSALAEKYWPNEYEARAYAPSRK